MSIVPPAPGSVSVAVAPSTVNVATIWSFAAPATTLPFSSVTSAFLKLPAVNVTVTVPIGKSNAGFAAPSRYRNRLDPILRIAAMSRSRSLADARSPVFWTTVSFASAVTARTIFTLPSGILTFRFSTASPGRASCAAARLVSDSFVNSASSRRSSRSLSPSLSSSAAAVVGTPASPSLTSGSRLGPYRVTRPLTESSSGMATGPESVMIVSSGFGLPVTVT